MSATFPERQVAECSRSRCVVSLVLPRPPVVSVTQMIVLSSGSCVSSEMMVDCQGRGWKSGSGVGSLGCMSSSCLMPRWNFMYWTGKSLAMSDSFAPAVIAAATSSRSVRLPWPVPQLPYSNGPAICVSVFWQYLRACSLVP